MFPAARPRATIGLAKLGARARRRLIGEAIAVAGISVVAVATIVITGVIGVEAAIKESVAETATEPSVDEAATEPSIAEAEPSIA
jgi:hypothetical protein